MTDIFYVVYHCNTTLLGFFSKVYFTICRYFHKGLMKNQIQKLREDYDKALQTAKWNAKVAAEKQAEILIEQEITRRGIKAKWSNYALGSTAHPKWTAQIVADLMPAELEKRMATPNKILAKIERLQGKSKPKPKPVQLPLWAELAN